VSSYFSNEKKQKKRKVIKSLYAIGVGLVEFLVERELITLKTEKSYTKELSFSKRKGYLESNCYAMLNFDLSNLPIKLNLPMVSMPLPWRFKVDVPSTLADIEGGYLSGLTGYVFNRFRLLTSKNLDNFYLQLKDPKRLCNVLNTLQSQEFEINLKVLKFIVSNRDTLEEVGLLMDRKLAKVSLPKALDLLMDCYYNDLTGIKEACTSHGLCSELVKRIQRSRYEDFILVLADAYSGYQFYLPAFLDFRGRIYRAGVLHFHERDLARSLIVFSAKSYKFNKSDKDSLRFTLACAAAFKYKKFVSLDQAYSWYMQNISSILESDKSLINFALQASDPFQFLAKVVSNDRGSSLKRVLGFKSDPVTQDASASAYQIMSYLLMNEEMARQTNLIPSPDKEIQDMYECLKHDLLKFLRVEYYKSKYSISKYSIIESRLTRKVVKTLFMPLIYGKTVLAMGRDICEVYGSLLRKKELYSLAKTCYAFWVLKYPDIINLMRFINLIGWFCSEMDLPVLYSIPYFTTVQDYMRSTKENVWVYDRVCKNRRRVTLLVPTLDRDKRKSQVATCVNFIHQKDAFIAMKVVEKLSLQNVRVYTVHDNFITTAVSAGGVPKVYTKVIMEMGPPLRIINEFIMLNLIRSSKGDGDIPLISDWVNDPIPSDELQTLLRDLEPKDKKFDKNNRKKKIQEAVSCYEKYINTVCGGQLHADKWNSFHSLLNSWESLGVNYSVHY